MFVSRQGSIEFFHYDLYAQALAKLQRRHERDRRDVAAMLESGLIEKATLRQLFGAIEAALIRYPGVDAAAFQAAVAEVLVDN